MGTFRNSDYFRTVFINVHPQFEVDSVCVLRLRTREDHQPDESLGQQVGGEGQLIYLRSHSKSRIVRRSQMTEVPTHWSSSSSIITITTITTTTNITVMNHDHLKIGDCYATIPSIEL